MDLPQLGPVAVLLLKSRRVRKPPPSGNPLRPETPYVTLLYEAFFQALKASGKSNKALQNEIRNREGLYKVILNPGKLFESNM